MTLLFRVLVAHVLAACIAGCAIDPSRAPTAVVTLQRAKVISAGRATDAVAAGKSTKADIVAALGETMYIRFDTGYEVWVYRLRDDTHAQRTPRTASEKAWPTSPAELVILFTPSGIVAKTRVRPAG